MLRPESLRDVEAATVRGTVATGDGWPVAGAAVTVIGAEGRQLGRGIAGEDGRFSVPVLATGPATVVVSAPGADPIARTVTVPADLGLVTLGSAERQALPGPGEWEIDPAHTIVRARARHLGLSTVEGRFTRFGGTIRVADPIEASTVEVAVETASIDTGNADRDAHLRSPDFLDVDRFPQLTYRGANVSRLSEQRWRIAGELTIRDVTRDVPLDVTYLGTGPDPWGGTRIALTAAAQLVRKDYDINWNLGLPGGFVLVGPTLRIDLEVQAVHKA
jgi:polyisoprenoid-binding protein YceI